MFSPRKLLPVRVGYWRAPSPWAVGAFALIAWGIAGQADSAGDLQIGAVLQRDYTGAVGERLDGEQRELFFDLPVYSNESVVTGNSASTALTFLDETRIQVGENSKIILDKFIYDPNTQTGDAAINFSKGVFRFVTGNMQNKEGFSLKTPSATLVIRGTTFLVYVAGDGTTDISVLEGQVEVKPCGGAAQTAGPGESVTVSGDCSGSRHQQGRTVPRSRAVDQEISSFGDPVGGDRETEKSPSKGRN
ncbi:MAG TPA: FecR family protein [Dongiaceae bacterium]